MPSTDALNSPSTGAHSRYDNYEDSGVDWLGEIPGHWESVRVQHVAEIHPSSVDKKSDEDETPVRLCNYTDVYYGRRITDASEFMEATASSSEIEVHELRSGDVLVTKDSESRDDIAVPALVERGIPGVLCGYHLAQLRPSDRIDGAYLYYSFKAPSVSAQFEAAATGITRYGLSVEALKKSHLYLPPLDEQRAIAAYLDRETERIDALIEKKEQLIDLLEEKRTALISRVVTKGLDADVEMQDSGVEWLGEIPAGWEAVRCGAIFREVDDRNHPDLPLLNVSIHSGVTRRTFSDEYIEQQAEDWGSYKRALEGDIVYNKMRFWQGAVGTAPIDGLVSPDYVVARTRADDLPKYYEYLFDTPLFETEVKRFSYGMVEDRFRLYWDRFKQMKTLRPPAERQRRIVVYLDRETNRVGELVEKVEDAIECLKEYRTALISAAVTGQIDVSDEVASSEGKEINTWARMNLVMELIRRMRAARHQSFGRTMLVKMLYLIQHHLQVSGFRFQYKRKDYGPYAPELRYEVENSLRDQGWISVFEGSEQVEYELQEQADDETVEGYFQDSWGDIEEQIDEIVSYFHHFDAEQAEIVATLYAAWNDLLILDQPHSEDDIIHEVRHNWHPRKQTIDEDRWRRALRWMKEEGLVPSGFGEPTVDDE